MTPLWLATIPGSSMPRGNLEAGTLSFHLLSCLPVTGWSSDVIAGTLATMLEHEVTLRIEPVQKGWWSRKIMGDRNTHVTMP